jgi:hypothetical protein
MPRLTGAAPSRPAHLSRRRHPAPWSQRPTGEIERVTVRHAAEPAPLPVFVDESGRRRRVGQMLGVSLGTLVLGYVVVVALTFGGAPGVGSFAPPGLGDLSRPAGDDGPGVGSGAQVSPLPTAGAPGSAPVVGGAASSDQAPAIGQASDEAEPSATSPTTAPAPTTTTTAPPGQGTTTSAPVPNSTVPERTPPTGGPPTEPPGKP